MSRCRLFLKREITGENAKGSERHVQYPGNQGKAVEEVRRAGERTADSPQGSRVRHSRHIEGRRRGGRTPGGGARLRRRTVPHRRRHRLGDRLQDAQTHAGFPFPTALRLRMGRRFPRSFMDVGRYGDAGALSQYGGSPPESRSPDARTESASNRARSS